MKKTIFMATGLAFMALASCKNKEAEENIANDVDTTAVDTTATAIDATATTVDTAAAQETSRPIPEDQPVYEAVSGKVTTIANGKDGYTATLLSAKDSTVYDVVISIPNLKDPKQFKRVKEGDKIMAIGQLYNVGERHTIKAETLK